MDASSVKNHFDTLAKDYDNWKKKSWYYYLQLKQLFAAHISPGQKVLEVGCGTGDILASVAPRTGHGIDISGEMIKLARAKHQDLSFWQQNVYQLRLRQTYDAVILCDLIDHLPDIYQALHQIRQVCTPQTKVVVSTINPIWEPVLHLTEKIGMKMPEGPHNWVPLPDLINIFEICGFTIEQSGYAALIPKHILGLSNLVNRHISQLGALKHLAFVEYLVSKKAPKVKSKTYSTSIIIPVFNEADNITPCIKQVPRLGKKTEIIVVDDGSTDKTNQIVRKIAKKNKAITLITFPKNQGKARAVAAGFARARGQILLILDADMTVPPQELTCFYELLAENRADFVNGTRMVYPMEKQAMRYFHLLGNKFFSSFLSWLLNQRVTDTLCGTKALFKKDARKIILGNEPWGDFDLLFGAANLQLRIKEYPVHYKKRQTGESKMHAISHGLRLLYMCGVGMYRLKIRPFAEKLWKH